MRRSSPAVRKREYRDAINAHIRFCRLAAERELSGAELAADQRAFAVIQRGI